MGHVWRHFSTITQHKWFVLKHCFRVGLYRQGLAHDMSKYGPTEFRLGAKYFQGVESPHNAERREKGYSLGWLHHKGRNMHHSEYWTDFGPDKSKGIIGVKMPKQYVIEMFIDRLSASKTYKKERYHDGSAWEYYQRGQRWYVMHPDTKKLLAKLLWILKEKGEAAVFSYIKDRVLKDEYKY